MEQGFQWYHINNGDLNGGIGSENGRKNGINTANLL